MGGATRGGTTEPTSRDQERGQKKGKIETVTKRRKLLALLPALRSLFCLYRQQLCGVTALPAAAPANCCHVLESIFFAAACGMFVEGGYASRLHGGANTGPRGRWLGAYRCVPTCGLYSAFNWDTS